MICQVRKLSLFVDEVRNGGLISDAAFILR